MNTITFPAFTQAEGDSLTYSATGTAFDNSWVAFTAATRELSLDPALVPPEVPATMAHNEQLITVRATVTDDPTVFTDVTFALNDMDDDGIVDDLEYHNTTASSLFSNIFLRAPVPQATYYPFTSNQFLNRVLVRNAMDPKDATDAALDFDGDGTTNGDEINAGTDPFIATSTGTLDNLASTAMLTGGFPEHMAVADFDRDGDLDAAFTTNGSELAVSLNNGDGTFSTPFISGISTNSANLATADVNSDGFPDLLFTDALWGFEVYTGDGTGSFIGAGTYTSGGGGVVSLATGDLNKDGAVDVVVTNSWSRSITVFFGDSDGGGGGLGTFTLDATYPVGLVPEDIEIVNVNNDGDLDIVTANNNGNSISVLLNGGDGTFGASAEYAGTIRPNQLAIADFNNDGHADVAASNAGSTVLDVWLNNDGAGDFLPKLSSSLTAIISLTTADFDGDGNADLAYGTDTGSNRVCVILGEGDGTFGAPSCTSTGGNEAALEMRAADLDRDFDLDLIFPFWTGAVREFGTLMNR